MKRLPALLLIGATSTVGAACGSDDDHDMDTSTTTGSTATATAGSATGDAATFNDADVTFAQGMIPHHEQAIEMAELALDPARQAGPDVVDLATRIQAAQDPEIQLMTGWLTEWGQPRQGDMGSMDEMMSETDMEELAAATGVEFDRRWLQMMSEHHRGAIDMAETEQTDGVNPDAVALAGEIIAAQQTEIDEMRSLLEG